MPLAEKYNKDKENQIMQKQYITAELNIVRIAAQDIIVTSPQGFGLNGISAGESSESYTTDGTQTSDYVL